jgi:hypothetical protein
MPRRPAARWPELRRIQLTTLWGTPVAKISVHAKTRELVGLFKNQDREWRKVPIDVDMYGLPSDADCVAIPYGIYDVTRGDSFVIRRNVAQHAGFRCQRHPYEVAPRGPYVLHIVTGTRNPRGKQLRLGLD